MSDAPPPGNIMSEPVPSENVPSPESVPQETPKTGFERLCHARDEAVGAVGDIVKARPMATLGFALGLGLLCGIVCRKSH